MLRSLVAAVVGLLMLLSASAAVAQTVGTTTNGFFNGIADSQAFVGQRIVAPTPGLKLQSFRLSLERTSGTFSVTPEIYEVTAGAATGNGALTLGAPLWTGVATPVAGGGVADYTFTPGPTIALDPARIYVVGVRQTTAGESGNVYSGTAYAPGDGIYENAVLAFVGTTNDLGFQATFAPLVAPVPTLSEWAMMGLGLLLAAGAVLAIQRRRVI